MADHLDWSIQAMNSAPRKAAQAILAAAPQTEDAVADLVKEIHHWKDAWAAVTVDKDRSVRAASDRALDCEHHGKIIKDLEAQLDHVDKDRERIEKGRLALLGGIFAFDKFVAAADVKAKLGEPLPDAGAIVEAMRTTLKKVHAAHTRAWKR